MKIPKWSAPALMVLALTLAITPRLAAGTNVVEAGPDTTMVDSATVGNSAIVPAAKPTATPVGSEVPGVTYGIDERFRWQGINNSDFNSAKLDTKRCLLFRTRPYADININSYLEVYSRLAWEGTKNTADPSYPKSPTGSVQASPFMAGEMWIDQAYLKVKKFPGLSHVSLQAGRFDIFKGEGFIFGDGSALDTSRDVYFNAFDLAYTANRSKIELIGIYDPKYDFFAVANRQPIVDASNPSNQGSIKGAVASLAQSGRQLNEWDEAALGAYYTNRDFKNTDFDAYTFFKKDYADIRLNTNYLYLPDRHYTVVGGRFVHRPPQLSGFSITGEFAYEVGTEDSMTASAANLDIRAWGGYGYAKKKFKTKYSPYVIAGFWALSGQDPESKTVGDFDPVFSRWPNNSPSGEGPFWSEFYGYGLTPERGIAYWTNMKMAKTEAGFTPWKPVTFVFGYSHMNAMQPFSVNPYHAVGSIKPAAATAGIFGNGLGRGQLLDGRLVYRVNKNIQGYFNMEKFLPGDFYTVRDSGYWYRFDITYRYKGFVPFSKLKG